MINQYIYRMILTLFIIKDSFDWTWFQKGTNEVWLQKVADLLPLPCLLLFLPFCERIELFTVVLRCWLLLLFGSRLQEKYCATKKNFNDCLQSCFLVGSSSSDQKSETSFRTCKGLRARSSAWHTLLSDWLYFHPKRWLRREKGFGSSCYQT